MAIIVFLILRLIPGDPATLILQGTEITPDRLAQVRAQFGLDQPLPAQFVVFIGNIVRGDFGYSYLTSSPVSSELAQRIPSSLGLASGALIVALAVGIPAGILAGVRPNSFIDRVMTGVSVLGIAIPYFWLALLLISVFAVNLRWFPALGVNGINALVLPSIALGLGYAAIITRLLRSSLITIYQQPYILVARAKGLSESRILFRHALRNGISSSITMIGLQIGNMLAGAVAIEVVFGRPGIGYYLVDSVNKRDIPAIQAIVLLIAVLYVVINIIVDILQGILDPKVRKDW
ncbi:MAG: ABC-type transporter, integral rane subunit [Subtercola sp.]|nr:ABC-type transporter, integral rane subunit [Subtercola sp.]